MQNAKASQLQKGFEWIKSYVDTDMEHAQVLRAFKSRMNSENGKQFKFGIQVARNPKHALQLDKENGTTGWADSIRKELKEIMSYETF